MRYSESRFDRRLKARRKLETELATRRAEQPKHPQSDPRIDDDRRKEERRVKSMTPSEVEDWMRRNGISGGDRRKGQRRQGDRRRR